MLLSVQDKIDILILEEEMAAASNLHIATDGWFMVSKGMVRECLEDLVKNQGMNFDLCVSLDQ